MKGQRGASSGPCPPAAPSSLPRVLTQQQTSPAPSLLPGLSQRPQGCSRVRPGGALLQQPMSGTRACVASPSQPHQGVASLGQAAVAPVVYLGIVVATVSIFQVWPLPRSCLIYIFHPHPKTGSLIRKRERKGDRERETSM